MAPAQRENYLGPPIIWRNVYSGGSQMNWQRPKLLLVIRLIRDSFAALL
jgi:hypothetical protein